MSDAPVPYQPNKLKPFKKMFADGFRGAGNVVKNPLQALSDGTNAIATGIEAGWAEALFQIVEDLTESKKIDPNWLETPNGRYLLQQVASDIKTKYNDETFLAAKVCMFIGLISNDLKEKSK